MQATTSLVPEHPNSAIRKSCDVLRHSGRRASWTGSATLRAPHATVAVVTLPAPGLDARSAIHERTSVRMADERRISQRAVPVGKRVVVDAKVEVSTGDVASGATFHHGRCHRSRRITSVELVGAQDGRRACRRRSPASIKNWHKADAFCATDAKHDVAGIALTAWPWTSIATAPSRERIASSIVPALSTNRGLTTTTRDGDARNGKQPATRPVIEERARITEGAWMYTSAPRAACRRHRPHTTAMRWAAFSLATPSAAVR